ncbi:LisH and RanBPM domains containing protein [Trifolium repens]|nr:LisH and RanBPM domains containing protein [Trifolium repens]
MYMLFSKTVWLRYRILLQQVSEFVSADFGANYTWFLALFVAANEHKENEALEFAQTKLSPFGKEGKYMEKLEDFMALLAYKEPEDSPMFHLLSFEHRQQFADSLNRVRIVIQT